MVGVYGLYFSPQVTRMIAHLGCEKGMYRLFTDGNKAKFQTKSLQTTISNLTRMEKSSSYEQKTLWEKEKLLVTSNFSFSHSVFKRLVLQTHKNGACYTPHNEVEGVYLDHHGCPSVCPWTQICLELFSYSFAHTALKFLRKISECYLPLK